MSNLSDLLPAGAAAKQLTFTDSGSGISSKAPVVLNSDGTVAQITGSTITEAVGALSSQIGTLYCAADSTFYDETTDKLVAVNASQSGIEAAYATISGSSTSWVTATNTTAFLTDDRYQTVANITDSNQFVVSFYKNADSYPYVLVATIDTSGGSIVWSTTPVVVNSANCYYYCSVAYDPTSGNIVCSYNTSTSTSMSSKVGTISGTGASATVSFGSAAVISSTVNLGDHTMCSVGSGKVMLTGYNASTGRGNAYIGTVSGTSVSWGALAETDPNSTIQARHPLCTYIPRLDRVALGYSDVNPSTYNSSVAIGAVSGTSTSWGTNTKISSSNYSYPTIPIDQPNIGKMVVIYALSNTLYAHTGTINTSTNVYTVDSSVFTIASNYGHSHPGQILSVCSDNDDQVPVSMRDASGGASGDKMFVKLYTGGGTATNLTATNFVGVADSAISASAAGSVIVQGGTVSGITLPANANTFGATVEWEADRSNQTTGVYDPDNQSIVYLYVDVTNSSYPTIVEGNISGDTLTFGTPAVVTSSGANVSAIAYETTSNKFLCQYTDGAYGGDIIGKIVTLSGGTFTMGNSATIFSDSTNYVYNSCVAGGGYVGSVAILDGGTYALHANLIDISGATPTIGTEATLSGVSNNRMYRHTITYDSTASKFIIVCNDNSSNSYYSIGSVSGSDMTLTSGTQFGDSGADDSTSAYYLAAIDKTFFTSQKASDGTTNLRLASLSGSTLTFGTAVNLGSPVTGTQYMGDVDYDTVNSKIVVTLPSAGGAGDANCFTMDSTGTTLTYNNDLISVGNSVFSYNSTMIYHTAAQKSVLGYDYLDSGATDFAGKSNIFNVGTVPVGSKYFVQTDGTLSTTADTPSVNAGLAISTTSLLLNGDS